MTFPEPRDNLSAVITDQTWLKPDLLLGTVGIDGGDSTLITTLTDSRVGNGQYIINLIGYDTSLGGLTVFETGIGLIQNNSDIVVDNTGDTAT